MEGIGAKDEIRTRDPDLGKVVLYQLSYFRVWSANIDRNEYSARDNFKIFDFLHPGL